MADLPGTEHHPHARATLGAALAAGGRPSHAYLFHGPAGSGKRTAARAFAAALLAEGASDPAGARTRVEHGTHPDLTWVAPSGAHEMLVGDVEEPVVAAAAMTPFEASRRVFVLERADTLIEQAANKLLKTLEEPAPFVHLILLTDRIGEVLPTIRSRCQLVRFDALPPGELAERVGRRGVAPEQAAACARLALGDGERALELALGDGPALRAGGESLRARGARRTGRGGRAVERAAGGSQTARRRGRRGGRGAARRGAGAGLQKRETSASRTSTTSASAARAAASRRARSTSGCSCRACGCATSRASRGGRRTSSTTSTGAPALSEDAAGRDPQRLRAGVELVEETRRRLRSNVTEELALETLAYRLEAL